MSDTTNEGLPERLIVAQANNGIYQGEMYKYISFFPRMKCRAALMEGNGLAMMCD
jgi:hypothetical protein